MSSTFGGRFIFSTLLGIALITVPMATAPANADGFTHLEPDDVERFRPVHTASSGATLVADIDSATAPVISPDGERIAFSGAVGSESLGLYAIFTANIDGSGLRQETEGAFGELDPVWSPDGNAIFFSQNQAGSYIRGDCCRIASVDLANRAVTGITGSIGAIRPAVSPDGSLIAFDNPSGVWTVPVTGGTPTLRVGFGFDATFSPDGDSLAFVNLYEGTHYLQTMPLGTSEVTTRYSTSRTIESPLWRGGAVRFIEYSGAGYEGRSEVEMRSVNLLTAEIRTDRTYGTERVGLGIFNNDELMFYRTDGVFRFYAVNVDSTLPTPMLAGAGYTPGWSSIAGVDLDGDGQDEMFFYRSDGLFRFYHVRSDGSLPRPLHQGADYTSGWDAITSVDLDGDGRDELFFYRSDGLFRYYDVRSNGTLPTPLLAGAGYTAGWNAIESVDLDGDGQDEMFFYRNDGLYRFYDIKANGELGSPIAAGADLEPGWDSITSLDIDGDAIDELLFYDDAGAYRYSDVSVSGALTSIATGVGYTSGWDELVRVELDSIPG